MKKSLKNVTIKLLLSFMIVAVMAFFMPINVSAAAPGKGSKETIEVPEEEPSEIPEEPSETPEEPSETPEEPEEEPSETPEEPSETPEEPEEEPSETPEEPEEEPSETPEEPEEEPSETPEEPSETPEEPEEEPSETPEEPSETPEEPEEEPSEIPEEPSETPEEPEIQVRSSATTTFTWEVEAETPAETPSATTTWNWEVEAELPATGENDILLVVSLISLIMFFATYLKKNNRSEESASIQNEETKEAYGYYSQNSLFEGDGALVKGFQHLVFMVLCSMRTPLVKDYDTKDICITGIFQSVGGRLKNCS